MSQDIENSVRILIRLGQIQHDPKCKCGKEIIDKLLVVVVTATVIMSGELIFDEQFGPFHTEEEALKACKEIEADVRANGLPGIKISNAQHYH